MKKPNEKKKILNSKYARILFGAAIGALAGGVAILYRTAIQYSNVLLNIVLTAVKSELFLIPVFFIALFIIAIAVVRLIKYEPMISGSGIPQFEGEMHDKLDQNWFKILWAKFVGGALTILCGLSVGREGPSIQLGAAVGKGVSKFAGLDNGEIKKIFMTCGAAAGLSAAFNAPLAGVIFVIEEVRKKFSKNALLPAMAASLAADFVSQLVYGTEPVFGFQTLPNLSLNLYPAVIVLGIITGIFGVIYNRVTAFSQNFYSRLTFLKPEVKLCIPFAAAGIFGLCFPYVLGGGQELVGRLGNMEFSLLMILIILVMKFIFSMISFGSGVPGGIFLPLLVLGSLIGALIGRGLMFLSPSNAEFISIFIILAMAGTFTGIVKAPVTGMILMCEMTESFRYLLPLALVSLVSYIISDLLKGKPIYDQLLSRILRNAAPDKISETAK